MLDRSIPSRGALVRDALIFHLKLWLDGLKDVVLLPLSIATAVFDFIFRTTLFYRVLRAGERFDLWLNLFGAAHTAHQTQEGLFGASQAGDPTLLGRLEPLSAGPADVQHAPTPPN